MQDSGRTMPVLHVVRPGLEWVPLPSAARVHQQVYRNPCPKELTLRNPYGMLRDHVWSWRRSLCIRELSSQDTGA